MKTANFTFPFLIFFFLLGASLADLPKEAETNPVEKIGCDKNALDLIINKLEDLNNKVNILDAKLTIMTTQERKKIKSFHTLKMVSQTVSALKQNQLDMSAELFLLKKDLSDIKTATQRIGEEPEWTKKYFPSPNEHQTSPLHSKLNTDIHRSLENQYFLEQIIRKYLEDNIPKNFTLSKQDLHSEITAIQTSIETVKSRVNTISEFVHLPYNSCVSALESTSMNGVYRLSIPNTDLKPFDAYCLKDEVIGSNWTIIQRRQDGSVDFYRDWEDYKHGFGNPEGEYWLGLEKIYAMTSQQPHELWIELGDWEGEKRYARYSHFEIGNEENEYYLKTVGIYTGTAGDSLEYASTMRKFSTRDADNDIYNSMHCAKILHGSWWYNICEFSDLNGQYNNTEIGQGVNWFKWHGEQYSLKYVHMAIRPLNWSNFYTNMILNSIKKEKD